MCKAGLCGFDSQAAAAAAMQKYKPDCVLTQTYRDRPSGLGRTGSHNKALSRSKACNLELLGLLCSNVTFALLNLLAALSQLQASIHSRHTAQEIRLRGPARRANICSVVTFKMSPTFIKLIWHMWEFIYSASAN